MAGWGRYKLSCWYKKWCGVCKGVDERRICSGSTRLELDSELEWLVSFVDLSSSNLQHHDSSISCKSLNCVTTTKLFY